MSKSNCIESIDYTEKLNASVTSLCANSRYDVFE